MAANRLFPHRGLLLGAIYAVIAVGLAASPAQGSDYGLMVEELLLWLAALGGGALVLGAATAAILVWICRRKWVWFLVPAFAVCWLFVIWMLYAAYNEMPRPPEPRGPATQHQPPTPERLPQEIE